MTSNELRLVFSACKRGFDAGTERGQYTRYPLFAEVLDSVLADMVTEGCTLEISTEERSMILFQLASWAKHEYDHVESVPTGGPNAPLSPQAREDAFFRKIMPQM